MAPADYTLLIGDKNYSSWSMRPRLALKAFGIPFAEECIRLRQPDSRAAILEHSPSGKVPALKTNGLVVWDSLAIVEFLAERRGLNGSRRGFTAAPHHEDSLAHPEEARERRLEG